MERGREEGRRIGYAWGHINHDMKKIENFCLFETVYN
jgi:hypothetical protein